MVRVFLLIGIALYSLAPLAQAQNVAPHQHSETSDMIDGAVHPELIPDSIAYRLYFLTNSTGLMPTEEDQKRQQAQLGKVGLQDDDLKTLVSVLSEFRATYDALVAQYNRSAQAATARNEAGDMSSFLRQRDGLVESTRDTLKLRLTPGGILLLDSFVRSEKKHMKVHTEGQ